MTFSLEEFNMEKAKAGFIDYNQPIPADTYNVKVVKAEHDQNKNNDGTQLYVQLEVVEGLHAGRRVSTWFKTSTTLPADHPEYRKMTEWISDDHTKMANFFDVVLGRKPTRFSELLDRKVKARVGINKNQRNDIKGYARLSNQMPQIPQAPQPQAPVQQQAAPPRPGNGAPQAPPSQPWLTTPAPKATVANVTPDDVAF